MSEQWMGLHNPERHRDNGADYTWCAECENHDESGCFPADPCRCCLEAEVAARRAQVIDYEVAFDEAVTAQCRDIVMDALRGKQALEAEVEKLRAELRELGLLLDRRTAENEVLRAQVERVRALRQDHCPFCFGSCACDGEGN